jgi:heat-inducible transcriptional repressor
MTQKALKPLARKGGKRDREKQVLIGLVEYYLKHGKPVGSSTLQEAGFGGLSSATIRNYFAHLEEDGYLTQLHSSGGRIPTEAAYRLYAKEFVDSPVVTTNSHAKLIELAKVETKEIAGYLQKSAELLSQHTNTAVFLSAPRFDQDFVIDMKLVCVDDVRALCVLVTDFGVIKTEVIQVDRKLSSFMIKRIEQYLHWKLTGRDKPMQIEKEEESLAQKIYAEVMVRFIAGYSNFLEEEIFKTGFSKLLRYPDLDVGSTLASNLSLFENSHSLRLLLKDSMKHEKLKFWLGKDLANYTTETPACTVMVIPYYINQNPVGAVGIMGPLRVSYRELFNTLKIYSQAVSEALTNNIFKYKINYRKPRETYSYLQPKNNHGSLEGSPYMLLEDKRD